MRKRGKSNVSYLLFGMFVLFLSFLVVFTQENREVRAISKVNTNITQDGASGGSSDSTPPTYTSYTGGSSSWKYSVTLSINGASDSGVGLHSTPYCFTTSSSSSNCSWESSSTLSITTQTNTYYYAFIRDTNGNIKSAGSQQVKVDRTAPSITNVVGGGSTWYKTETTLIVAATDSHSGINSTGYCFIGSSSTSAPDYSSCSWHNSASKYVETTMYKYYHIYVRDAVGNKMYYGYKQTLIDPTAPSAGISGGGSSWAKSRTLTISASDSISGLAGSPYCFISSTSTSAPDSSDCSWTSSKSLAINSTMDKYYHGYAKDKAGNIKYAGYQQVRVDVVAPTISCNGSSLSSGTHYFSKCILSFSDSASGIELTSVDPVPSKLQGAEGLTYEGDSNIIYGTIYGTSTPTTYTVQIYDEAGNGTYRTFTLYNGSPTIKCGDSTSSTIYTNSSCSLSFSDDIILSSYSISGPVSSTSSLLGKTKTYGTLSKEGRYTITVTNAAGKSSTTTLYIDKTNPYMYTTSGSNLSSSSTNLYKASQMTFYFGDALSGYSKATHDCQGCSPMMGSLYDTTSSPITLYASTSSLFYITVYDNADNNVKYTIEFDNTAPTIECGSKTLSTTNTISKSCTVYFSDDNFSRFNIQNGDKEIDTGYSTSYTFKGDGDYTIFAYDKVGNYSEGNITIDDTAPSMKYGTADLKVYPEINYISGSSATFTFEDGGSGFDYHTYDVSGSDATAFEKSTSASRRLVASYYYYIKAYDKAGNESDYHIVIDDTPPTIMCGKDTLSGGKEYAFSSTCMLTFDDDIAFSEYSINGTGFKNSDTYSLSKDGTYLIVAFDKAGNEAQVTVTIDTTKPYWSTDNVSSVTSGTSITFTFTDDFAIMGDFSSKFGYGWTDSLASKPSSTRSNYTTNDKAKFSFNATAPAVLSAKKYYLWITPRGEDTVGNSATYSGKEFKENGNYIVYEYTITPNEVVDNEVPKILCSGSTPSSGIAMVECTLKFTDNINLASYQIYDGGKSKLLDNQSIDGTSHIVGNLEEIYGAGEYKIVVSDVAGNTTTIDNILIKTNAPELKMNGNTLLKQKGYFVNSSVTLTTSESAFVVISGNQFDNEGNIYGFELSQRNYPYYETSSSISLNSTLESLLNTAGGYDLSKYGYALEIKLGDNLGNENIYYLNVCDIILSPVIVNGTSYTSNVNLSVYGDFTMSIDEDVKVKGINEDEFKSYFGYNKVVNIGTKNGNVAYTDIFGNTLEVTVTSRTADFTESDLCLMINGIKTVPENGKVYYSSSNVTIVNNNVGLNGKQITNDISVSTNGSLTRYEAALDDDVRVFYVYVASNPMMSIYEKNTEFAFKWGNTSYSSYMFKTGFEGIAVTGYDLDEGFEFYNWGLKTMNTSSLVINGSDLFSLTLHYANVGTVSKKIMFIFGYNNDMKDEIMEFKTTNNTEIIIEGMTKYNVDDEEVFNYEKLKLQIDDKDVDIYYVVNEKINPKVIINDNDGIQKVEILKNVINNNKYNDGNYSNLVNKSYSDKSYEISLNFDDEKDEKTIYKIKVIDDFGDSTEKLYILISIKRDFSIDNGSVTKSTEDGETYYKYEKSDIGFKIENFAKDFNENTFVNIENGKLKRKNTLKNSKISFEYTLLGQTLNINYVTDLSYDAVDKSDSDSVALYVQACIEKKTEMNYEEFIKDGMHISFKTETTRKLSTSSNSYREGTLDLADLLSYVDGDDIFNQIIEKPIKGYITAEKVDNLGDAKDKIEDHGIVLDTAEYSVTIPIYNKNYKYASFGLYNNSVPVTIKIDADNTSSTNSSVINGNDLVTLDMIPNYKKEQYLI